MALGISPSEIVDKGAYQLLCKASHWKRVPLSHVADVQNGFAFKSAYFDREDGVPLIRIRDLQGSNTEHCYFGEYDKCYLVRSGDILIGMDGDFTAARWRGEQAILNQRVCRIQIRSDLFDDRFLFLCLQPYLNAINAETSSVTVKHLSSKTVETIPFPLPPLNEQHRIVAKIEELFSELDKGIESLKTAREQFKVYRQSILKHAFEGKLTAQWREENKDKLETPDQLLARIKQKRAARYERQLKEWEAAVKEWEAKGRPGKKPPRPKKPPEMADIPDDMRAKLPQLPESWAWGKLGWLTCGVAYGTAAKSTKSGTVPVLRMGNIQNAKFELSDLVYTSNDDEIVKYLLHDGDVLFNRTNSPELVGKTAVYRGERPAIFAGYLIRVNHIRTVADSQYVNLFLNSRVAREYGSSVKTDGVNQSNINGNKLSNYPFPYCSIEEQGEIVSTLEKTLSFVDETEAVIILEFQKSYALRQSILKKAFSGQLVAQNPHDEPASVLLARIHAAKGSEKLRMKV